MQYVILEKSSNLLGKPSLAIVSSKVLMTHGSCHTTTAYLSTHGAARTTRHQDSAGNRSE